MIVMVKHMLGRIAIGSLVKIHLIGHSMGGQTVRLLEEMLRKGNPEEVKYQKKHGGDISPLYKGGQDNMVSSITTLAAPQWYSCS